MARRESANETVARSNVTARRSYGAIERRVRAEVRPLKAGHPAGESLAALAIKLAQTLDDGAGLAVAAVSRELRAALTDLAGRSLGEDDDDITGELSTPVLDTAQPEPADARPRRRQGRRDASEAADAVAAPRVRRGARGRSGDG